MWEAVRELWEVREGEERLCVRGACEGDDAGSLKRVSITIDIVDISSNSTFRFY